MAEHRKQDMVNAGRLQEGVPSADPNPAGEAVRALKNFRYAVAALDEDALKTWDELWDQFKRGATPAGPVPVDLEHGFLPACGWAEFLEKFWLLRHCIENIHRLCVPRTVSNDANRDGM
jgi:hypothetical protein